jgi:hypothetical protein
MRLDRSGREVHRSERVWSRPCKDAAVTLLFSAFFYLGPSGDKFNEIQLNLSISYCKDTEPFAYQRVPYPLSPTSEVISRTPENFVKPFVRWLALDAFVPK